MDILDIPPWKPPPPLTRADKEETHAAALARGANCTECPLFGCRRGPVPTSLKIGAKLTIVGEAPGKWEVEEARNFTGPSGRELDDALMTGGLRREQVTVANTIACQPPEDFNGYLRRLGLEYKRACDQAEAEVLPELEAQGLTGTRLKTELKKYWPPKPPGPIECCAPRLARDIEESGARTVLAVGGKALKAMADFYGVPFGSGKKDVLGQVKVATIKKQHGSPIILPNGVVLTSSLHPAFAMRGARQYKHVIRNDIARAAKIASRGNRLDWREPKYILLPHESEVSYGDEQERLRLVRETCERLLRYKDTHPICVDIETNSPSIQSSHVRCVGLGGTIPREDGAGLEEVIIVVPFRYMSGSAYWAWDKHKLEAAHWVRQVLDECQLEAHNGAFDTAVCLRYGLMSKAEKTWFDTMLAHHDTEANDLPHDLGFVTTRFLETPKWKDDVDHKAANNVERDRDLWLYNARDVLCTHRIAGFLREEIERCGTQRQFRTDTKMAVISRDMGDLGLVVDEIERGKLSKTLNDKCIELREHFRAITGVSGINPRSTQHLREWFFGTKKYTPVLNPQGYEWQEDDDPSTSSQALLRMLDLGVDPQTEKAIDTLLEFRAYDKLRGTYVDRLRSRPVDWEGYDIPLHLIGRAPAVVNADGETVIQARQALSILNTIYKVHVIPSGRWSTEPAVQNWPALGKANMRRMITSPPGHVMVGADYAQIEARLYALLAGDELLIDAIRKGMDIHSFNAASLFTPSPDKLMETYEKIEHNPDKKKRKYFRTVAKRFCFLEIYGGEEEKLYSVMSADRDKATGKRTFPNLKPRDVQVWHERWHSMHPWTKRWHYDCATGLAEFGFVATLIDYRKRFFPGGPNKKNAPPNHTIQGSAAAIMSRAVERIAKKIPHRGWSKCSGLFLQVHDDLKAYVPESRAEEAKEIFEKEMYFEHEGMPFPAEACISTCWADQD